MKKSHVSFILAAALAAALLAGCGSSGSSTEASGSKEAGSQSQAQDTGSQDGSGSGTEGALSGEITFWHSLPRGQDWRPSRRRQTNLWKKTRM